MLPPWPQRRTHAVHSLGRERPRRKRPNAAPPALASPVADATPCRSSGNRSWPRRAATATTTKRSCWRYRRSCAAAEPPRSSPHDNAPPASFRRGVFHSRIDNQEFPNVYRTECRYGRARQRFGRDPRPGRRQRHRQGDPAVFGRPCGYFHRDAAKLTPWRRQPRCRDPGGAGAVPDKAVGGTACPTAVLHSLAARLRRAASRRHPARRHRAGALGRHRHARRHGRMRPRQAHR